MIDTQLLQALIASAGAIIVAYITVKYKDYTVKRNQEVAPKDRMDTIFDGYESLIKQQQDDIERKSKQLDQTQSITDSLQKNISALQTELDHTKDIVRQLQAELEESKLSNKNLVRQLAIMKEQYGDRTKEKRTP